MSFYRLANAKNQCQTNAKRVLCVCSAGLLRSPTVANVLHDQYGYNTRAVGVNADFALIPVDEVLLQWADEVVCVQQHIAEAIIIHFEEAAVGVHFVTLNIEDRFEWNNSELQSQIRKQYREYLDEKRS